MVLRIAMLLDNPFRPDLRVLKEAEALTAAGHQITIIAWDRDKGINLPSQETLNGIRINRITSKTGKQLGLRQIPHFLAYGWRAFQFAFKQKYDVVHCHDFLTLILGVLVKWFRRVSLVYDAHEIYWIMEARKYHPVFLNLLKYWEIFLIRWVDVFITVGNKRSDYYHPYTKKAISIVGNWYDPQPMDENLREKTRNRLDIPLEAFVVTYAGTLSPVRASGTLIESIEQLRDDSQIHWIICGQGPSDSLFMHTASRIPSVHYLGWLKDLAPYFAASDALVYLMDPSHPYCNYNAPNSLYLSIAWGLPLIGIDAGEIGSIITTEESGLLVQEVEPESVSNAIRMLVENKDLHKRIVVNLRSMQKTYSWESAAEALVTAYEKILPGVEEQGSTMINDSGLYFRINR